MQSLILASSSPRRKELLESLRVPFEVSSSDVDESYELSLSPSEIVMELAERKSKYVSRQHPTAFIIGSDTIVVANNQVLGKPANKEEAFSMLKILSGSTHSVYTGVSIQSPLNSTQFYEVTDVEFWELTDDEIRSYVDTEEPLDKAGAYGIQGIGRLLVKRINGDFYSVVGLPLSRTMRELKKLGFHLPY